MEKGIKIEFIKHIKTIKNEDIFDLLMNNKIIRTDDVFNLIIKNGELINFICELRKNFLNNKNEDQKLIFDINNEEKIIDVSIVTTDYKNKNKNNMEKVVVNIDKCSKDELISALNSIKPSDNNEPRQFEININEIVLDENENKYNENI